MLMEDKKVVTLQTTIIFVLSFYITLKFNDYATYATSTF